MSSGFHSRGWRESEERDLDEAEGRERNGVLLRRTPNNDSLYPPDCVLELFYPWGTEGTVTNPYLEQLIRW